MTSATSSATVEHPIGARGRFNLRLPAGDVSIRASDGEIARVRDLDGRSLSERFRVEAGPGSLSLRAPENGLDFILDLGFLKRGYEARLEVELPRWAELQLDTASADVRVDGLRGATRYRTASGNVTIRDGGGTIELGAVSGDVVIASDGEVAVSGRTVSGDLTVRARRLTRLEVATTSGDVEVGGELAGDGPFSIETVSGDCQLATPTGLRIEAKTLTGDVSAPEERHSESARGRRAFSVGDGGVPFRFRSISGDLRILPEGPSVSGQAAGAEPVARDAQPLEPAEAPPDDSAADDRLEILRALERGELTVDEASARLAALDGDGGR
jgi:hypothetical protein